jgi:hypothetical protein
MNRKEKTLPNRVVYWVKTWNNYMKSRYMNLSAQDVPTVIKLAGLITLVDEKEQTKVFWALTTLLVDAKRKSFWDKVVDALPTTEEGLLNFSRCVRYYEKMASEGYYQSLRKGRINPITVTETIVQIGDAYEAYLDLYKKSYYTYPAKVFSQELIQKAGHKLRGRFGDFGSQQSDFQKEISESVETYDV